MRIRPIMPADDVRLAAIIRKSLETNGLALPGTAYFDAELDHLSAFYAASPRRAYFVLVDDQEQVLGGCGVAEFVGDGQYAELQKLYLSPAGQGHGWSYLLIEQVYMFAKEMHYKQLYLETHHVLSVAVHLYDKMGFQKLAQPLAGSEHGFMDLFFSKQIV